MDYELGLERLKQLLRGTRWESEFLVYEARMIENLCRERKYGIDEKIRSDRFQIVDQLNQLAKQINADFNALCQPSRISFSASSPASAQTEAPRSEMLSPKSSPDPAQTEAIDINQSSAEPIEPQEAAGEHILIASLGDSPVVITSMYHKLTEKRSGKDESPIKIDRVIVLYPEEDSGIEEAYKLVRDHLSQHCKVEVECEPLPFKDADSSLNACRFLQRLYKLLNKLQEAHATVYLSLAGGRKSMAALTAWVAQLFPCVQHLYHIIDPQDHYFLTLDALRDCKENATPEELYAKMRSNLDQLYLVDIPFPKGQRISQKLNKDLHSVTKDKDEWDGVFKRAIIEAGELREVRVTKQVIDQFRELCNDPDNVENMQKAIELRNCIESMMLPKQLESARKAENHQGYSIRFFDSPESSIRVFFYYKKPDEDNTNSADNRSEQVVICAFDFAENGRYRKFKEIRDAWMDFSIKPVHSIDQLPSVPYTLANAEHADSVLIVPLGNRPMIATQLYQLLTCQERRRIHEVYLVYSIHTQITPAATMVKEAFQRQFPDVTCTCKPIDRLTDITQSEHCTIYQEELEKVIDEVNDKYLSSGETNYRLDLALSGGRKGMTAMTIFAAQRKHIRHVYHTLITDEKLEDEIERYTTIKDLKEVGRKDQEELDKRLFLQTYKKDDWYTGFTLFPVPVFPVSGDN